MKREKKEKKLEKVAYNNHSILHKLLDKETDMECAICNKPLAVGDKVYAELLVNEVFLVGLHDELPSSLPVYHIDCLETFWFFNPDMKMVNQPINSTERSTI